MRNHQTKSLSQVGSAGTDQREEEARIYPPGKRGSVDGSSYKTRKNITPAGVYSIFLVSMVMVISLSSLIQPLHANPTCILNCAQCVKIYGDFFDGHSCAKVCMDSRTRFESFVDCADPTTIARFLKTY